MNLNHIFDLVKGKTAGAVSEGAEAAGGVSPSIPLGGNLPDYTEKDYTFFKLDTSNWTGDDAAEISSLIGYFVYTECPAYNVAVYRLKNYDKSAKETALNDLTAYYKLSADVIESLVTTDHKNGTDFYRYTVSNKYLGADVFYSHCVYFADGSDVMAMFFNVKSEKTALEDTGLSVYLPAGCNESAGKTVALNSEKPLKTLSWDVDTFPIGKLDIFCMDDSDNAEEQIRSMLKADADFVNITDTKTVSVPGTSLTAASFDVTMKSDAGEETGKTYMIKKNGKLVRFTVWENDATTGSAAGLIMGITED